MCLGYIYRALDIIPSTANTGTCGHTHKHKETGKQKDAEKDKDTASTTRASESSDKLGKRVSSSNVTATNHKGPELRYSETQRDRKAEALWKR